MTALCVLCDLYGRTAIPATVGHACQSCRGRLFSDLVVIDSLYAVLDAMPSARVDSGGRVSSAAESPLPARLDVLNLVGSGNPRTRDAYRDQVGELPVAVHLDEWVRDWLDRRAELRELAPAQTVRALTSWLRARLDWALAEHPGLVDYAREMIALGRRLQHATGRAPVRRVVGRCPVEIEGRRCGTPLEADTWVDVITCTRCEARWPRCAWSRLARELTS